ncbi:acyltransferase family protein [Xylophilus sp.]|uniref:acyltransferase family protein n=1 Tax=Xylophilus sp. TaxID=2653893 RepID=UPI0013BE30B6|nr:acyltransferase [Xylophilus sp.]KAF1045991.1 MAG: O-acetyltransferase OatA [Xylophilus sp.]
MAAAESAAAGDGATAYKPYLDGVRALSILVVAVAHGGLGDRVPGGLGVTVFFFVSGYLITGLLLRERQRHGRIDLPAFYWRRFWRLVPALAVYIAAAVAATWALGAPVRPAEPLSALFYLTNYFGQFVGYGDAGTGHSPYSVLWSLAVEEHFYLLFAPLLALLPGRTASRAAIGALLVLPLLVRAAVTHWAEPAFAADYTYHCTDTRIDSIAWGCLLAAWRPLAPGAARARAAFAAGLAGLLLSLLLRDAYFRQVLRYSLQGASLYRVFLGLIHGAGLDGVRRLLSARPAVFVGRISYSLYLYHWLAIVLLMNLAGPIALQPLWQAAYWTLAFAGACASYFLVERPTLRLRVRHGSVAR